MSTYDLNRRTFLVAGGAVVAGALAGCGAGGAAPEIAGEPAVPTLAVPDDPIAAGLEHSRASDPTLAFLTRHDFDRWHGEAFDMTSASDERITIELVSVHDQSDLVSEETREQGLREPFSVQFHGPLDATHQGGRYRLAHPDMGEILVHVQFEGTTEELEPRPVHGDRRVYELFFN